jgi:hypothetical protein
MGKVGDVNCDIALRPWGGGSLMRENYAAVQAACGVAVASISEHLQGEGGGRAGKPGGSYFMGKGGFERENAEAC